MKIGHKLGWGFTLVVIAIVVTAVFCLRVFWHIDRDRQSIKALVMPNINQTMILYENLVKMDHWIATFLLTGEAEAYQQAATTFENIRTLCRDHQADLSWPDAMAAEKLIDQVERYLDVITAMVEKTRMCGMKVLRSMIVAQTQCTEETTKKPITSRLVRSLKNISVTRGV